MQTFALLLFAFLGLVTRPAAECNFILRMDSEMIEVDVLDAFDRAAAIQVILTVEARFGTNAFDALGCKDDECILETIMEHASDLGCPTLRESAGLEKSAEFGDLEQRVTVVTGTDSAVWENSLDNTSPSNDIGIHVDPQVLINHVSPLYETSFSTRPSGSMEDEAQAYMYLVGRCDLLGAYTQTFCYAFAIALRERFPMLVDTNMSDFRVFERHWQQHNRRDIAYQYGLVGAEPKESHVRGRAAVLAAFGMIPADPSNYVWDGYVVENAEDLRRRRGSKCLLTIGPQDMDGDSITHLESFIRKSYGSLAQLFDHSTSATFANIGLSIPARLPSMFSSGPFIAVHYRAGEVLDKRAGDRFIYSSEYRGVLNELRKKHPGLEVHVFTSAIPPVEVDNLAAFDGCIVHDASEVDMITTWAIFIRAEAFVMSRSSFSHVAALFRGNRTGTYYRPMWHEPLTHWQVW